MNAFRVIERSHGTCGAQNSLVVEREIQLMSAYQYFIVVFLQAQQVEFDFPTFQPPVMSRKVSLLFRKLHSANDIFQERPSRNYIDYLVIFHLL